MPAICELQRRSPFIMTENSVLGSHFQRPFYRHLALCVKADRYLELQQCLGTDRIEKQMFSVKGGIGITSQGHAEDSRTKGEEKARREVHAKQ